MVESVVADRIWEEDERQRVVAREVAGIKDMLLDVDPAAIALKVMVG